MKKVTERWAYTFNEMILYTAHFFVLSSRTLRTRVRFLFLAAFRPSLKVTFHFTFLLPSYVASAFLEKRSSFHFLLKVSPPLGLPSRQASKLPLPLTYIRIYVPLHSGRRFALHTRLTSQLRLTKRGRDRELPFDR